MRVVRSPRTSGSSAWSASASTRPASRSALIAAAAPAAKAILTRAFQQTTGSTPHAEDVVVVAASSLLAAGGDATLVAERWRKSNTVWLKTRLEAILRSHQQGAG